MHLSFCDCHWVKLYGITVLDINFVLKDGETKLTKIKWNNSRIVNREQNKTMENKRIYLGKKNEEMNKIENKVVERIIVNFLVKVNKNKWNFSKLD